jgi:hypothetical protein
MASAELSRRVEKVVGCPRCPRWQILGRLENGRVRLEADR